MTVRSRPIAAISVLVAAPVVFVCGVARADYVTLRDGGVVRGEVVEPAFGIEPSGATVRVVDADGLTVGLDAEEVVGIVRRDPLWEEHHRRAAVASDDAASQWELAEWARVNRLDAAREGHLRAVIAADPEHREARIALGFMREDGRWMTRAEAMRARGLVEYDGRFVSPQERELLSLSDAEKEARRRWFGKVRLWVGWLTSGDGTRAAKGADGLASIVDPAAVPAVLNFLGEAPAVGLRQTAVAVLARVPGDDATSALAGFTLRDGAKSVRDAARDVLVEDRPEAAAGHFRRALADGDNFVVRRAAAGLELVGGRDAIPDLIGALVTQHTLTYEVPDRGDISVGSVRGRILPPAIEAGYLAGQYPDGIVIEAPYAPPVIRTRTVKVGRTFQNREVLRALAKIAGDDSLARRFGFDERAWRTWWHYESVGGGP